MLGKSCNGTDCTDLILIITGPPGQCTHRDELTPPLNQLFFSLLPNVVLLQSYLIINATDFLQQTSRHLITLMLLLLQLVLVVAERGPCSTLHQTARKSSPSRYTSSFKYFLYIYFQIIILNACCHFTLRVETLLLVWSLSTMSGSWVT